MTMVVAYTWQDKIIMMADSRSSTRDDQGKMIDYTDEEDKIIPVENKIVIGHAGLGKVYIGAGNHFDLNKITERFLELNQQIISKATGEQLLLGLVKMWNRTLSESMGRNPFSVDNRFCFLLAKFEPNGNGELKPKIHTYQSHFQKFNWGGKKAVVGDEEVYPIIKSYFDTETDDWTFNEALDFYQKGFTEVIDQVDTVGGVIDIYVLDKNPEHSHWLKHEPKN
ncbi:hypothetical protein J7E63_20140 [Bacillus sp. ISL-75]|uniref:hypothetical protein n=1 Tax=Bacillus sp. ISL-75 TaxID=2819137 RepID=UPI001BE71B74|nr:hypothetical protein [Bacillus sp. ISL-75]MBT2729210.1 hypothetical protein [Bacillus sp. ISL-75]